MRSQPVVYAYVLLGVLLLFRAGEASAVQEQAPQDTTSSVVTGTVIDAETGTSLSGVNVFLANTTQGAATDAEGRYAITGVAPGPYDVVASMLGYTAQTIQVDVHPSTERVTVDFQLQPTTYELDELEVAGERPRRWRKRYKRFEEHLLGQSPNAKDTEILNPYVLDFKEEEGILTAQAPKPLLVENRGMGYRITFVLLDFRLDQYRGTLTYRGMPYFSPLEPESQEEAERWRENRENAFYGSLQHLLWALVHDRVEEERFELREDDRPSAPFSNATPEFADVEAADIIEATDEANTYTLRFDHFLHVTYENEDGGFFLTFWKQREPKEQVSWLEMIRDEGKVDRDGSLHPPTPVKVYGYIAKDRLADKLPREFVRRFQGMMVESEE